MLESARLSNPDFPDGETKKLTNFAYMGQVETPDGIIHIATQSEVILGMLSPRGLWSIQYFDESLAWIGRESLSGVASRSGPPLYANGSVLYFFGPVGAEERGDELVATGKALDFSGGFEHRRMVFAPAYGSWHPDPGSVLADSPGAANPESP